MHTPTPTTTGFKRQVVFRIGPDDWPLLQAAANEHGSIQAAVIAALHALADPPSDGVDTTAEAPAEALAAPAEHTLHKPTRQDPAATETAADEEITAREAARILGLKTSTISGYIRTGRLPGRYASEPTWRGWLTTRAAVSNYRTGGS